MGRQGPVDVAGVDTNPETERYVSVSAGGASAETPPGGIHPGWGQTAQMQQECMVGILGAAAILWPRPWSHTPAIHPALYVLPVLAL
jgi:hypothetical protein